ncbi:MAG: hypothetical protein IPJ34_03440 [Myxococcales bacterium]|nr:hypothetical protein [Myxococcales bacterium]
MEERSPPVAVRVVRPFADEQSLLDAEVGAFSRTGIVLIGAPSRPNGVVLRFEVCLRDGTAVMRGEGRVVGYRAPTAQEEGALMLRFTRLDVKSKSLLDRAVALREERRSLPPPPPKERLEAEEAPPPSLPPPSLPPPSMPPRATASVAPRVALPSVAPVMTQAEPEPVAMPEPAPAATTMDVTDEDVEEIDDADIASADPNDLTEQVPPVAETPAPVPADETVHGDETLHAVELAPSEPVSPEPEPVEPPREEPPREPEPVESEPIAAVSAPRDGSSLARLARGKPFSPALAPEARGAALDRLRARRR